MKKLNRSTFINQVQDAFKTHPVVALLGPRQCGKTTLAQEFVASSGEAHFFDLENPVDAQVLEQPKSVLDALRGVVVLDEIQRTPHIFPLLRVLVDQEVDRKFLVLGSASRDLIQQSSESLAGRIAYIEVSPFSLIEVDEVAQLWQRGGFPKSYLAKSDSESLFWRQQYISTFLERDLPGLGIRIAPLALRRFWMMITHYHGQMVNLSEMGSSLGIAGTTARHYLDILTGTYMLRQLLPWYENMKKRQIKTPKVYFRDSGIFHALCGVDDRRALLHHPKLGASWEGFALEEVTRALKLIQEECFYWGIHAQAELDLFVIKHGKRIGFEFKYNDAPTSTKSMQLSIECLKLDRLYVIYPGEKAYQLSDTLFVIPLAHFKSKDVQNTLFERE